MAVTDYATNVGDNVLYMLREFGFFRLVLPIILIFALVYGVLVKTRVLGDNKQINVVLSFAIAFIVVASTPVVEAINKLIPASSFILVATLMILMILTFTGFDTESFWSRSGGGKWKALLGGFLLFIFAGIIDYSTGFEIPILHDIFEVLMGRGIALSGEGAGVLIGLFLVLGLPLIIMFYVTSKS